MANRVTPNEVKAIIEVDDSIDDLQPFIMAANILVTNTFSGDTSTDAATLKEIERYLAAHLICTRDPRAKKEGAGGTGGFSVEYMGKFGAGLDSSPYGQTAKLMDPSGALARIGMKKASLGIIDYSTSQ